MTVSFHHGDCREVLRTLPDKSVHCCVTSPPYFGLRDYGVSGQIGLEATPDAFVAEMVAVFREVRRVLRDDGTLFLNLGDSYFGGGGHSPNSPSSATSKSGKYGKGGVLIKGHTASGSRRAAACDTAGKEPEGSPANDCLCQSLCGACRAAYRIGKSHNDGRRAPMPPSSSFSSSLAHMELPSGHLPTSDLGGRADRNEAAILDLRPSPDHEAAPLIVSHLTTMHESSLQHPVAIRPSGRPSECQLCGCSLVDCARAFADMSRPPSSMPKASVSMPGPETNKRGTSSTDDALSPNIEGMVCDYCSSQDYNMSRQILKPKDLIGIPWRVAFALQADGWYLRQDIIWSKPNPMPESVTDRCTKAHEYIFLLSKSARYYYDADAIAEVAAYPGDNRAQRPDTRKTTDPMCMDGGSRARTGKPTGDTRNRRSVWEVTTQPFSEAHFATFPPALIEPCIKAGCPEGGTVLDCFGGAGTTGLVADRWKRDALLIELNPEYAAMAERRIRDDAGMFFGVSSGAIPDLERA